jgi:hypothetical protein
MRSQIFLSSFCTCHEDEVFGCVLTVEPHPFNKSVKCWYSHPNTEYVAVKNKYAHAYFSFWFDHVPYLPPMPVIIDVVKWRVGE